ncbi:MAG: alpha/beta fold hydrolase [Acidimicrobiales bacterium]
MSDPLFVASADDVRIAVHDLGGGPGNEVLLICHATGFCGRAYEALADELSDAFHVWAIDFRGHGDSSVPADGNFSWGAMARDLLVVIDAISDPSPGGARSRANPIAAFGHSLGASILMLAERVRPGTLRAAHLFEPIVAPPPRELSSPVPAEMEMMAATARRRQREFASRAEALFRYARHSPLGALQARSLAAYVEHAMAELEDGTARLKCSPESEAATFEAADKPTVEALQHVETPTTVSIGTTERGPSPAVFGPAVAQALPNGRLERHQLLGHFGPLQDPAAVAATIRTALAT